MNLSWDCTHMPLPFWLNSWKQEAKTLSLLLPHSQRSWSVSLSLRM